MNKLIQKIADEARFSQEIPYPHQDIIFEKFSELILTEVISTIYRSDISERKQERLVDELAYKFGLKE
jgi:hypothetical protein